MKPARLIAILFMVAVLGAVIAFPVLLGSAFSKSVREMDNDIQWGTSLKGDPVKVGQNDLAGVYTHINQAGPIDVEWKLAAKPSFTVSGPSEAIEHVRYRLEGENLRFGMEKGYPKQEKGSVKIVVYGPQPESFSLAGTGKFIGHGFSSGDFELSIAGSGDCELAGSVEKFDVSIAGSGSVNAKDLKSTSTDLSIAGSGTVQVRAEKLLEVNIAGSGDVVYFGNPTIDKSIMGHGSIRSGD